VNGLALYCHLFGHFAQLQLYVNADGGICIDDDPTLLEGLESLLLNLKIVNPDRQILKTVEATLIGVYDGANTSLSIDGCDRSSDDQCAAWIGHNSGDAPGNARPHERRADQESERNHSCQKDDSTFPHRRTPEDKLVFPELPRNGLRLPPLFC